MTNRTSRGTYGGDYDPLSKALHWTTMAFVLTIFALALWPGLMSGSSALHRSLGIVLLFLVLLRIGWRLAGGSGGSGAKGLEGVAAKAMHLALYGLLIALPMLGWLYLDLKGTGVRMFGFAMPALADPDRQLAGTVFRIKWWLAYGMLGATGLHATAALTHHYLLRDDVLVVMLPRLRRHAPDITTSAGQPN